MACCGTAASPVAQDERGHTAPVTVCVVLPDGDLLSASEDGTIKRWTKTPRSEDEEEDMDACGFREDGVVNNGEG